MKNGQSKDTDNIGHTRHRTKINIKYTKHRKPTWTSTVNRGYPGHREVKAVPASSYKTPTMSQIVK
jgi:hypothetical protein